MDPIIREQYRCHENNLPVPENCDQLDPYKADIFSLGVTYLYFLGIDIKKLNESKEKLEYCSK